MTDTRQICIILDSNVWLGEQMLRSNLARSLVHAVAQLDAVIALPDIVDGELKAKWPEYVRSRVEEATKLERILVTLTGQEYDSSLPSEETLLRVYDERIMELQTVLLPVQLTLKHAKGALARINAGLPPCGKNNEQFRDAAIWEAVLQLANKYDVRFITNDSAFFVKSDHKQGVRSELAPNLVEDCKRANGPISCYRTIDDCLAVLDAGFKPYPDDKLAAAIVAAMEKMLTEHLEVAEFKIDKLEEWSVKIFPTGKPLFSVSWDLTISLTSYPKDDKERKNATLDVTGRCVFDPKKKDVSQIELEDEILTWTSPDGRQHRARRIQPSTLVGLLNQMLASGYKPSDFSSTFKEYVAGNIVQEELFGSAATSGWVDHLRSQKGGWEEY